MNSNSFHKNEPELFTLCHCHQEVSKETEKQNCTGIIDNKVSVEIVNTATASNAFLGTFVTF